MPYVAGESLRDRLTREKQLPIDDALRLSKEVASALDYAHRQGVVHRDIKPENILLQEGSALVADFGIALAVQQAGGCRMTQTGMSLGTPAYMSPEQAMGERDIGARSDVYALGAMTYEMLTGEPPFTGLNSQAIVAKVLTETPPPLRPKRPTVPPTVEHAVLTALQKLPADRFGTAKDFADALDGTGKGASYAATVVTTRPHALTPSRPGRAFAQVAAAGLIAATATWALLRHGGTGAPPAPTMRFSIAMPPGHEVVSATPSLSADGQLLAFMAESAGTRRIFLRSMGTIGSRRVAGSDGAVSEPVLAGDGASVIFQLGDRLVKAPTDGSQPPTPIPGAPLFARIRGRGFDVADDGALIITPDLAVGLLRLDPASQRLDTLRSVNVAAGEYGVLYPTALPGGRVVLFCLLSRSGYALMARTVDGKREVRLIEGATAARFGAPNSLVFSKNSDLYIVGFDVASLRTLGDPRSIAQGLPGTQLAGSNAALFTLSQAGILAVLTGERGLGAAGILTLMNRDGSGRTTLRDSVGVRARFSPDGRSVVAEDSSVIWLYDLTRGGTRTRFSRGNLNYIGVWTPDGRRIVTSTYEGGPAQLWSYAVSDPADAVRLTTSARRRYAASFTPDGSTLAFIETTAGAGSDILVRHADGSETPVVSTSASEHHPRFSPNGRLLAYASEETGQAEVYVQAYPEAGRPVRVSVNGGNAPVWDPSGRELFFVHDKEIVSVTISGDVAPTVGPPRLVLRVPDLGSIDEASSPFDISPDGRKFLIMVRPAVQPARELQVLVNLHAGPR